MKWKYLMLVAALCGHAPAWGQISVPDQSPEHTIITMGCDCIVPENGEVKIDWKFSDDISWAAYDNDKKVHVTGPPGLHWAESTVVTQTHQVLAVLLPDKEEPKDITKATWGTVKVALSFDISRYEREFEITGVDPGPDPEPDPDPGPDPDPEPDPDPVPDIAGLAGEMRKWLKAVPPASYSKARASGVADNYLSIGSQGGDPARSGGWNLDTFRTKTKDLNYQTLTTEDLAFWAVPFFKPLAEHMAKTFAARNLKSSDVAGISKLWTEYGEAMKKAAY